MSTTKSETTVTQINQNIFFKEFTFDKNNFKIENGYTLELADNILWLDELLIIIQIKERAEGLNDIKSLRKWFDNKILRSAKKQIKDTLKYLDIYKSIKIRNGKEQEFDIKSANIKHIHNIIIYSAPDLPTDGVCNKKYYTTKDGVFMHIFSLEDYLNICKYTITPIEFENYLFYRRDFLSANDSRSLIVEQFTLAHFFHNPKSIELNELAVKQLPFICRMTEKDKSCKINKLIDNFQRTLMVDTINYLHIVREIAKLSRLGMTEFNKNLRDILKLNLRDMNIPIAIKHFHNLESDCGFVFIRLKDHNTEHASNALFNLTEEYKYMWKSQKWIGVVVSYEEGNFDRKWAYADSEWKFDAILEDRVKEELEWTNPSQIKPFENHKDYYQLK